MNSLLNKRIFEILLIEDNPADIRLIKEVLKDIGIERVQVSLDGFKETHDRIRGKENYDNAINAIRLFAKNNFNTHVQTTVLKDNIKEIPDLCKYLIENFDISKYKFTPLAVLGRASSEMMVSPEEYKRLYDKVIDLAFKYSRGNRSSIKTRLMFDYIGKDIPGSKDYVCEAFRECLSINYYGDVYPCSFLPIKIGNIREETIKEAWNKESPLIRELRTPHKLRQSKKCSNCNYLPKCGTGCIANSYNLGKGLFGGDAYCWV